LTYTILICNSIVHRKIIHGFKRRHRLFGVALFFTSYISIGKGFGVLESNGIIHITTSIT